MRHLCRAITTAITVTAWAIRTTARATHRQETR